MTDKIKIAYNWIGPRGPIPNTEIPNLLNISSVSDEVQVTSGRFWADNIWPLIFCNDDRFQLSPSLQLDEKDTFIFPFTLAWRIPFFNYFYNGSGLFEFAHTPQHILHHVRFSKGYILIDISAEAWVEPRHLETMHSYFNNNNIPLNKVIYLTGCMNANKVYDEWLIGKGLTCTEKINIISYPISQDSLAIHFDVFKPEIPEYDTEKVPDKVFLSWNRRFRQHRIAIVAGLEKLNLLDRSYVSMGITDPENEGVTVQTTFNPYLTQRIDVTDDTISSLVNKLPLVLDGETETIQMCQDFDNSCRSFYQNSLVSLITETNFDAREVTLTEKSFKPSKEKHPFIIIGAPGALQGMRDMGFKTFSDFWDESYDLLTEPSQRMIAILDVINQIGSWNNEQIIEFRRKVKPILDHNYETLKIRYATVVAGKIATLIQDKQNT